MDQHRNFPRHLSCTYGNRSCERMGTLKSGPETCNDTGAEARWMLHGFLHWSDIHFGQQKDGTLVNGR